MQNDPNSPAHNINYDKELKVLNSKITTLSGYMIAMRSDNIKESQKTEDALKLLIKQTYDIRGGLWVCLITLLFLAIVFLQKSF